MHESVRNLFLLIVHSNIIFITCITMLHSLRTMTLANSVDDIKFFDGEASTVHSQHHNFLFGGY